MKQKALLLIDIDLEQEGITGCRFSNKDNFCITVRKDVKENFSGLTKEGVVASLTHELGHMLAVMFEMPGMKQDFRVGGNKPICKMEIPADPAQGVIACETEAWDLGFLMLEAARIRTEAMKSYTSEKDQENIRQEAAIKQVIDQLKSLVGNF